MTTHSQLPSTQGCLQLRRERLADPRQLSPEARRHLEDCALCQAFVRRADAADARLAQVLESPSIPEGLNERILLRALHGKQRRWQPYALAASLLLASFIGLGMWQFHETGSEGNLALAAALHAQDEANEVQLHRSEPGNQLPVILASFGGKLEAPLGEVSYIHFCPVEGFGQGWHIVYNTPQGKVTLLLIAAKEGAARVETVQVAGKSVQVERAGAGYYAIIADDMPSLKSAGKAMKNRVRWST